MSLRMFVFLDKGKIPSSPSADAMSTAARKISRRVSVADQRSSLSSRNRVFGTERGPSFLHELGEKRP